MKTLLIAALCSMMLLYTQSCSYDKYDKLYPVSSVDTTGQNTDTIKTASYSRHVVPLLQRHCYRCHSKANAATLGQGIQLEGYARIHGYAVPNDTTCTLLGDVMHLPGHNPMPQDSNKLPASEISILKKWVLQGALQN